MISPRHPTDGLSPELLAVYEALPARASRHPEQLVRDSGVPLNRVRSALPLMNDEQKRLVVKSVSAENDKR